MSLVAYRIAHLWVTEQAVNRPRHVAGPTPLQYGLMLQVLGASSILSLYDAVRYLSKGPLRRPIVPAYFTTVVVMGLVVYVTTHLIALGDLWLHATTTAVLYNLTTAAGSEPLMTSLEFNQTYCTKFNFPPLDNVCMTSYDGWAQSYPRLVQVGQSVVSNSSTDRMAITLADANNAAVIVPLAVNKLAKFKATTFGMRAHCESLNNKCEHVARQTNCTSIGITAIPSAGRTIMSVVLVPPALHHEWNADPIQDNNAIRYGISIGQVTNPVGSILQLRWSSQTNGAIQAPNAAVDTEPIPALTVYASCSIEVLNATVTYDGTAGDKTWALVPEQTVLSENRFATALIAPYSWQLVTDRLVTNIQARAMISETVEEVMSLLNQELARLALGFVSGSFIFVPATDVQLVTPTILGRYPLAPLLSFVLLLMLYGLIALAIFVMTINATSGSIHIPAQLRDKLKDKTIPELELAQIRLTSPLPVVAQLFAEYKFVTPGASDPDARSAKASAVDLFSEYDAGRATEMRLRIGLESEAERPRYGLWKDE
ncbi:hypothetical protein FRC08_013024 [Ceratobasidium sp. 394]|nr:hypothetical protein FRC08_013024 [Ceratobasidium sp. 394]